LATAMEARCYRGGESRTRLHELTAVFYDYLSVAAALIFLIAIALSEV